MSMPLDPSLHSSDLKTDANSNGHSENLQRTGESLRTAWDTISGDGDPFYFGPERQGARIAAREAELQRACQEPLSEAPDRSPNFTGGEHAVWVVGDPATEVFKKTQEAIYGQFLDEKVLLNPRTFQNHRQLALRPALPSEYLLRWLILYDLFKLPTFYRGQLPGTSGDACLTVAQPYIDQDENDPPTLEDVTAFMEAYDFVKVPTEKIAVPEIQNVTWYRQRDGILITDAFPRNFRKHAGTHALVPIDLVVSLVPLGSSKLLPPADEPWTLPSSC